MNSEEHTASFGYWVRRRRQALDLTQAALARQVGCATVTISKIERDERRPSRQMAELLADNLRIDTDEREKFLAVALGEVATDNLALTTRPLDNGDRAPADDLSLTNIPFPMTAFVGREQELKELARLLANPDRRLITILGVGGIGKTRLSLASAADHEKNFRHGVCFVPLASLERPEALVAVIGEAVRFSLRSEGHQRQQLLDYFREKSLLLILDSFEHVLAEADLVHDILRTAPGVKILVTSRRRLNLRAETSLHLDGLTVSPTAAPIKKPIAPSTKRSDAITLFTQSATQVKADFEPSASDWPAIHEICDLVEGAPLALILAAGWITILSPQEIAAEIRRNLDFLETDLVDLPPRQRSIRAVFEYSWASMADPEKAVFQQLSILSGGFDREAAEAIAGASLRTLTNLMNHSLLQRNAQGRYELHGLLRQYAGEKLAADPQTLEQTQNRHSSFFRNRLKAIEKDLIGSQQQMALAIIETDLENLIAAWNWGSVESRAAIIDEELNCLYEFFRAKRRYEEGAELFQKTAKQLAKHADQLQQDADWFHHIQSRLNVRSASLRLSWGENEQIYGHLMSGLERAKADNNEAEITFCLNSLGLWAQIHGNLTRAEAWHNEALNTAQAIGDTFQQAIALERLGLTLIRMGNQPSARSYFQQSLRVFQDMAYQPGIASAWDKLAAVAWRSGDYEKAERFWTDSLSIFRDLADDLGIILALSGLGQVAMAIGGSRLQDAIRLQDEALGLARQLGFRGGIVWLLAYSGAISNMQGLYEDAIEQLQEALAICEQDTAFLAQSITLSFLGESLFYTKNHAESRDKLTQSFSIALQHQRAPAALLALMIIGAVSMEHLPPLPWDGKLNPTSARQDHVVNIVEILSLAAYHPGGWHIFQKRAEGLLEKLETFLPPDRYATAVENGRTMDLEAAGPKVEVVLGLFLSESDQ